MEYINKYADAQGIQDALDAGTLGNPYVVLNEDTGELDFNTLTPSGPEPEYMGYWSDDGEGNYTFQITETADTSYFNDTYIGTINSIEYAGTTDDAEILLTPTQPGDADTDWDMKIHQENGSETIVETFWYAETRLWDDSGFMVDSGDSNSALQVYWDGYGTFTINSGSSENPLSISTSDPEYPEGE